MSFAPESYLLTLLTQPKMSLYIPSECPIAKWKMYWNNVLAEMVPMYQNKEVALCRLLKAAHMAASPTLHSITADKVDADEAQFAKQGIVAHPQYVEDINAKGVWLCVPHPKSKTLVIRIDLQFKHLCYPEEDEREIDYDPIFYGLTGRALQGLTYVLPTFKVMRKTEFPKGFGEFSISTEKIPSYINGDTGKPHPTCCLCGKKCDCPYGHNPQPVMEGTCCSECNFTKVLPARIAEYEAAKAAKEAAKPKPSNAPSLDAEVEVVSGWIVVEWDDKGADDEAVVPPCRIAVPPMPRDEVCEWLSDKYGWCVNNWKKE